MAVCFIVSNMKSCNFYIIYNILSCFNIKPFTLQLYEMCSVNEAFLTLQKVQNVRISL